MSIDATGQGQLLPFARAPRISPTDEIPSPAMFRSLAISASGLSAQRARMDVATQNIANADVTRTPEGGPYRRRIVDIAPDLAPRGVLASDAGTPDAGGVRVAGIRVDASEGPRVYDPGHPDASPDGYVQMPNVRATDELVSLLEARRLFEANVTVFEVAKASLHRALDI